MPRTISRQLHPARRMPFHELVSGLDECCSRGIVYRRHDQSTGRTLYCYTKRCVYEQAWDRFSVLARGLIVDMAARRIVATPFPKFFNAGERDGIIPDLPFEVFEKVDGSLIIIHFHAGRWMTATKGDFGSSQAAWAQARLDSADTDALVPGTTYLAEAVYRDNRLVIRYDDEALVLLAAYGGDGAELDYEEIQATAAAMGWRYAPRQSYSTISDLMQGAQMLPGNEEGYVLRFSDGTRLKIKGAEYRRMHALIARCTPLGVWDMIAAGSDLDAVRKEIPEEFWTDFDSIRSLLEGRISRARARIAEVAGTVAHLSDKELGMMAGAFPSDVPPPYVFAFRRYGEALSPRSAKSILRDVRPTGDVLEGYVPSYAARRVADEDG